MLADDRLRAAFLAADTHMVSLTAAALGILFLYGLAALIFDGHHLEFRKVVTGKGAKRERERILMVAGCRKLACRIPTLENG